MSGRAHPQDVQQHRLVVTGPTEFEKSALRLPAVSKRGATILRPLPIHAAIELIRKGADFLLVGVVRVEIDSRRQRSRQQESAVYRRQLALPGAPAAPHVEKMII